MASRLRIAAVGLCMWALALAAVTGQSRAPQSAPDAVTVEGNVVDDGLNPLPGARVALEGGGSSPLERVTDAEGRFALLNVRPGPYRVRASASGFESIVRELTIHSTPSTQHLPLALRPSAPARAGGTVPRPVGQTGASTSVPASATSIVMSQRSGPNAAIGGVVTDSSGGVIPGATVVVSNAAGVITARAVTNGAGTFSVEVPAGAYQVTVSLQGFRTARFDKLVLASGGSAQLHVALEIGAMSEVKDVVATTELVKTADAKVAATIGADQISNLPPTAKNALNFVTVQAGATSGATAATSSTILGLPQSTTAITIDGATARDRAGQWDGFHFVYRPQADLVEEVTVNEGPLPTILSNGGESYLRVPMNRFQSAAISPLSTFAADVDTASFTNVRRILNSGQLPPAEAVRIEELINYFRFAYPEPRDDRPISLTTESAPCPWAPTHRLVLVGARAKTVDAHEPAGRNIVLLIDVSGSMPPAERLPLIKTALRFFVDALRDDDRVAIVTYAGTSGLALPSTPVRDRARIFDVINSLTAGGSTNGGEGLIQAYRTAIENYMPGGVNRVLLATDGDFNVGIVDRGDLVRLIDREKTSGVFLSVFGVGSGNLKDATMELLADRGNGHYAYLDSLQEARRALVREADATLETVAKDVKFQVEFNPATVAAWRLIGYEDRRMAARDFNDDRKGGGELGAGHTVTVLYEIVPTGVVWPDQPSGDRPAIDPLKYQPGPASDRPEPIATPIPVAVSRAFDDEWLTVKVRYQRPTAEASELMSAAVRTTTAAGAPNLSFASAIAEFGLLLRSDRAAPDRWAALLRRVRALDGRGTRAADRDALADLIELAAGLSTSR